MIVETACAVARGAGDHDTWTDPGDPASDTSVRVCQPRCSVTLRILTRKYTAQIHRSTRREPRQYLSF